MPLLLMPVLAGCWIPLPEETAIVVKVLDARNQPVDGASFVLDGSDVIVTGSQANEGEVFVSLNQAGEHTLQLETASLIDPQGGVGWVPLASRISGESDPLSFQNRPFAGGSDVLIVPVNKNEITVATIYLDDILESPRDNQWVTDGLDTSNVYRTTDTDEFTDPPSPTFWWRQDPSLGQTVIFTFQLWEDDDGDTRYPMGVIDEAGYNAFARTPDWEESNQAMFNPVTYSSGGSNWPLGWTYAYAGTPLGTSPASGQGEYVWRVIQENPDRGISIPTKLGAFYTYSGYFYASTESGGLDMSRPGPGRPGGGPSTNATHRDVFGFVERAIFSADVMGTPFDSTSSAGYRQRTTAQYTSSLAAGSGTTNQLVILYNTDEDGQAVVSQATLEISPGDFISGFAGILRVLAQNKQRPLPTPEPHMQDKEFQMTYFSGTNELEINPPPFPGESGVYYEPPLADPDYQDPLW